VETLPYTIADGDFYKPISAVANAGTEYRAGELPAGWERRKKDVWTVCTPAAGFGAEQGWKVHVSATLDRAQHVLDAARAGRSVPFR
jgi:hypothetical protein